MVIFFLTLLFLLCFTGFLPWGRVFPLAPLTYWCKHGLMDSYFTQWVIILCCHYLAWCSNCPRFGRWESFQTLSFIFCDLSPSLFFEQFLIFWRIRCSRFMFYFSCSSPRISHLSEEPWFISTEQCLETQSSLIATEVSLLLEPQWTELGHVVCVCIHAFI